MEPALPPEPVPAAEPVIEPEPEPEPAPVPGAGGRVFIHHREDSAVDAAAARRLALHAEDWLFKEEDAERLYGWRAAAG